MVYCSFSWASKPWNTLQQETLRKTSSMTNGGPSCLQGPASGTSRLGGGEKKKKDSNKKHFPSKFLLHKVMGLVCLGLTFRPCVRTFDRRSFRALFSKHSADTALVLLGLFVRTASLGGSVHIHSEWAHQHEWKRSGRTDGTSESDHGGWRWEENEAGP